MYLPSILRKYNNNTTSLSYSILFCIIVAEVDIHFIQGLILSEEFHSLNQHYYLCLKTYANRKYLQWEKI